jgi:hypothetical protein
LTPSARSGDLIAGDGTKNGLSRSEQKTLSTTQNNRLTGKAPYKSTANLALAVPQAVSEPHRRKNSSGWRLRAVAAPAAFGVTQPSSDPGADAAIG